MMINSQVIKPKNHQTKLDIKLLEDNHFYMDFKSFSNHNKLNFPKENIILYSIIVFFFNPFKCHCTVNCKSRVYINVI